MYQYYFLYLFVVIFSKFDISVAASYSEKLWIVSISTDENFEIKTSEKDDITRKLYFIVFIITLNFKIHISISPQSRITSLAS